VFDFLLGMRACAVAPMLRAVAGAVRLLADMLVGGQRMASAR